MNNNDLFSILLFINICVVVFAVCLYFVKKLGDKAMRETIESTAAESKSAREKVASESIKRLEDLAKKAGAPTGGILAASYDHLGYSKARNQLFDELASIPFSEKFIYVGSWISYLEIVDKNKVILSPEFRKRLAADNVEDIYGDLMTILVESNESDRIKLANEFSKLGLDGLTKHIFRVNKAIVTRLASDAIVSGTLDPNTSRYGWN